MIQIFGTAKCKTTRAAQRFFADRRIPVQVIDLREKGLSRGELTSVARAVGGMRALYDPMRARSAPGFGAACGPIERDGARVKERGLQHSAPDDARLEQLFLEDPLLLRTPIVRDGQRAAVGAAEAVWKAFAEAARGSAK